MAESSAVDIEFTGEFFVPGKSGERIEADHMERYRFAAARATGKAVFDIACGVGYGAPLFGEAGATETLLTSPEMCRLFNRFRFPAGTYERRNVLRSVVPA